MDKRQGEPGTPVLLRRLQLPSDVPAEARQHVARAARDALELRHAHLVPMIEVLEEGQELAIVYEHVEAEPLRSLQSWANLRGLTFPVGVSLKITADLLRALSALHGVVGTASVSPFGGLSPDSVLVTRAGDALLCDGLVASCASLLDSIGCNTAKLGYAAPEQVHAVAPLTPPSDVFACGAMLWELLTARRLLSGSRAAIERRLLEHSLPSLASSLRRDQKLAGGLLDLVERALAADPAKRPSSPEAMLEELQHCGEELASRQQIAEFVGKLSGQRLDRRNAAVRSKSLPELQAPLELPVEVPASTSASSRHVARAAAAPASKPQTERSAETPLPASSAARSPAPSPAPSPAARQPAPRAVTIPKPSRQRPPPAGLPPETPEPGSALPPSSNLAVQAPADRKPITARLGAPVAGSPAPRKPSPSYVEPPPIPEAIAIEEDDESDATIREQPPEDWLGPPATAAPLTPTPSPAAPPVAIVPMAVGRRTVAGVGNPAHPALSATLPFAHTTPEPFAAAAAAATNASLATAPAPPVVPLAPARPAPIASTQPFGMAPPAAGAQPRVVAASPVPAQPFARPPSVPTASSLSSTPPPSSVVPASQSVGPAASSRPSPARAARSFPPGIPSLRGYEPTFAMAPEELVPRVAPSARVMTRPRSGWARALGLGAGKAGRGRALLAGAAACIALASAVAVALLLRRPTPNAALALDGAATTQDVTARELAPPPGPEGEAAERQAASDAPAAAQDAPDAAAPTAAAPAGSELAGNLAAPRLDDQQLLQLFALEQYQPWSSCPTGKAARAAARKKGGAKQAKEAVRLLKAARSELVRGNDEKARSLLCRATAQDPSNSQAQQALAELALRFGNAAQAQAAIEKALARKPEDPTLLGILGDALAVAGDLPGSRRVWLRAMPSSGSDEERLRLLAGTYRKLGDRLLGTSSYAAACALFRRAIVLSEGSYTPSIGLAESLRRLQQPRAALAWAERAAHAFPKDARVQLLFGDILYDNGQKEEARSAWRAARKAQPNNALAALRLAKGKP